MHNAIDERKLGGLTPARRNRYYYGKLMDVLHFSMEQQYVLAKEWLLNRAVIGGGVVCGLDVEPVSNASGHGIVIRSGLGIDWWGREIVVPDDVYLVPLVLTDQCGKPHPAAANERLPNELIVKICYDECCTDFAPAFVSDPDCGCGGDCEAGTIIETYCLKVLEGQAPPVEEPCFDFVMQGFKDGNLHKVLCELSRSCAKTPDDPCLTLANVKIASDGKILVDSCTPRPIAPTNRILMQLIRCLAECCGGHEPPPPHDTLQVTAVRAYNSILNPATDPSDPALPVIAELKPPSSKIVVGRDPFVDTIEIEFGALQHDPASIVVNDSVKVPAPVASTVIFPMPGNRFRLHQKRGFRKPGVYKWTLIGDPGAGGKSPSAVLAVDGTRLDGEFPTTGGPGWHSGDGVEGGDFSFQLEVI